YCRDDKAIVSVRDTGIGIPPGKREIIFDMFAQVHGPRGSGKDRGLGIGLHIVKRLVELHHGTVVAHSAGDDTGSEFVVELPLLREPVAAVPPKPLPRTTDAPLSILVVDDNRDAAESLASLLDILGHKVQTAFSGTEALDIVARACPEILLLDIGMPDIDGHEVARRIRASPLVAQPVIVAVSGWGQAEDKNRTAAAGFNHHLVKPVDLAHLQQITSAVTEVQRGATRH
ncbi:MAG TPA: response regulator, partial [Burkholderiales bacterium]|nr:response regulator [Burkholderiales bacterium]